MKILSQTYLQTGKSSYILEVNRIRNPEQDPVYFRIRTVDLDQIRLGGDLRCPSAFVVVVVVDVDN